MFCGLISSGKVVTFVGDVIKASLIFYGLIFHLYNFRKMGSRNLQKFVNGVVAVAALLPLLYGEY